jgi:outer membrane protein assembly factor BamB
VEGAELPRDLEVLWRFSDPEYRSPAFASSPAFEGGRVFAGVAELSAFGASGRVVALDADSGKRVWEHRTGFPVFSSPSVAGGLVYVGEGFHQDSACKLFALRAEDGAVAWSFETRSHVESSPHVDGGRVVFGAGDDGVYCLDALRGKEVWHLPDVHVDLSPLVAEGRVFGGTGYGELAALCLDAKDGKVLWRTPVDLAVWGSPVRLGNRVYFGLGNGNFLSSSELPKGAVLCLSASSGREVWRRDLPDAVLTAIAAARGRLFAGSRDGNLYALDPASGEVLWKCSSGGGAIVASPLVVNAGKTVLAASTKGMLFSADARSGAPGMQVRLAKLLGAGAEAVEVISSPVVQGGAVFVGTFSGEPAGELVKLGRR